MVALLLAGTVVFCAGMLAIVFGIPIKEFSFGNTMIIVGSVVSSTGLVLIGLGILAREVRQAARRLGASPRLEATELDEVLVAQVPVPPPAPAPVSPEPRPAPRAPANGDFLFARDDPAAPSESGEEFDFPPPTREQSARAERAERFERTERPERTAATSSERPRRDFLFSSRRRRSEPEAAPDLSHDDEASAQAESGARESQSPPSQSPPWVQASRSAAEEERASEPRHPLRPSRSFTPPPRREPEVSVVKSGVVDSMAYSLYSDGSIEAQLPEGTVRFDSIEELRSHLDQRG